MLSSRQRREHVAGDSDTPIRTSRDAVRPDVTLSLVSLIEITIEFVFPFNLNLKPGHAEQA